MVSVSFLIAAFLFLSPFARAEAKNMDYTFSSHALQRLVAQEQKLLPLLLSYLEKTERKLETLSAYINDARQSLYDWPRSEAFLKFGNITVLDSEALSVEVSSHPLKSYRLIERLSTRLETTLKECSRNADAELWSDFKKAQNELPFPTQKDLGDAKNAVLRLKLTYNMTALDLVHGTLNGLATDSGLDMDQCVELGHFSLRGQVYTTALDFYETAYGMAEGSGNEEDLAIIRRSMDLAIKRHDAGLRSGQFETDLNPFHFQGPLVKFRSQEFRDKSPVSISDFVKKVDDRHSSSASVKSQSAFEDICQGQDYRSPEEVKDLTCKLVHSKNPYFILQPLRVELKHRDPEVVQIYNVLSDREMKELRAETEPLLARSLVLGATDSDSVSGGRTSSTAWIPDYEPGNKYNYIARRVGLMTGLMVNRELATEQLQIANYMPGGFYGPHFDAAEDLEEMAKIESMYGERGDRVATFMIYLSDVEMGGGTGFPRLGFGVQPIKGSAIFWYNLRPDGSLDPRSLHGGCPLLYGLKYIANKWIRSQDQMFLQKCPLVQPVPYTTSYV